jgi:predicted amidophosphoribosyltransferase
VLEPLTRLKNTKQQWTLGRQERMKNLEGAFQCGPGVAGSRILIIDDVCTSGASLEACAQVLQEAGAAKVSGYVLARQSDR